MKKYYVSLVYDLMGYYLEYNAESEKAVRQYLARTYYVKGVWKIPWCAVYSELPIHEGFKSEVIPVNGTLYEEEA